MERKLNLCIVRPNKSAYSETFINNHIKYLPATNFALHGSWYPQFTDEDINICDLYINRNIFSKTLSYLTKILPQFIYNRISTTIKGFPYDDKLQAKSFEFYLKQNKIDVVLAEFGLKGIAVMEICKKNSIPLVVHFHGADAAHIKSEMEIYEKDFLRMFEIADTFIAVSKYIQKHLESLGVASEKIFYMPCGANLSLFKPTTPSLNPPNFVAIGRLTEKKAPLLTLLAFQKVIFKHPESKLIFVGKGELWETAIHLTKALQLEKNVIFKGVLPPEEVAKIMFEARAFVQHSIFTFDGEMEGTPVAVLEAGASGLPVISTRHTGIADVVVENETGFLVDEHDIESMSNYMIQLVENTDLADTMGKKARQRVVENYSLEKNIADLYQAILSAIKT